MTQYEQKSFTTYSSHLGRDPEICRQVGGHWVNEKLKRCNNCYTQLQLEGDAWVEVTAK